MFENHKNVKKIILRTLEQARKNICSIGYQNSNLKIGLSLFGCAQKYTKQSTHSELERLEMPHVEDSILLEEDVEDLGRRLQLVWDLHRP